MTDPKSDKKISASSAGKICSGRSIMRSYVRFVNKTQRNVDVVWLNFEGHGIRYKTLKQSQHFDINTYVGHPWIFRDKDTGDKLCVELKEVFYPQEHEQVEGRRISRRIVNITIPVYSLRERSLQVVRRLIPRSYLATLDIPQTLRKELLYQEPDPVKGNYQRQQP